MEIIKTAWESYQAHVVSPNAGATQIVETRSAFYTGAAVLFMTLTTTPVLSEGDEPTEGDLAMMQSIQDEIDAYGAQLDKDVFGGTEQ